MKKVNRLLLSLSGTFVFSVCGAQTGEVNKPNIIFILADDLGYGDVSSFNPEGKILTPNIDRMASRGVMFTDAHTSSAVSTPSRYGILTGRYNWRSTLKSGVLTPFDKPLISSHRTTMASMLKEQGYQTACIGKWHLGMNYPVKEGEKPVDTKEAYTLDFSQPITEGPLTVGFNSFFGVDCPNYPPYCFIENQYTQTIPSFFYPLRRSLDCRAGRGAPDWNLTEILPALPVKAAGFIEEATRNKEPFFLYMSLTSPHTPIVPTDQFNGKSGLNVYVDFVMQTDAVVGDILNVLEKNNILENTIVVFSSDNGCSPSANFPELEEKGHYSSAIYRGSKADIYEGGHRVPCIVQWPAKVKKGIVDQTICLNDFMATFAAITAYQVKDNEAEDSYNILPLLLQADYPQVIREATVHHSIDGSFAIRQNEWKLILTNTSGGWSEPQKPVPGSPEYQLYNIKQDPSEKVNVVNDHPAIVDAMKLLLVKYIREGRSTPGKPQQNDIYPWKQIEKIM